MVSWDNLGWLVAGIRTSLLQSRLDCRALAPSSSRLGHVAVAEEKEPGGAVATGMEVFVIVHEDVTLGAGADRDAVQTVVPFVAGPFALEITEVVLGAAED